MRDDGEPTRRRAARAEFTAEEWRLVSELADYPNRLLVIVTTETGVTYAEVAHEAIFRRWGRLREWIAVEREFLAWHNGLEVARRAWQAAPERSKRDALLMGFALTQAQSWIAKRADDIPQADRHFIQQSRRVARSRRWRVRLLVTLVGALSVPAVILGIVLYAIGQKYWREAIVSPQYARIETLPYVLTTAQEQALKPGDSFRECARDCPEMIVVPSGLFVMGAPEARYASQIPQHTVTIPQSFAVSKYELTSANWEACLRGGGCNDWTPSDSGWGRGERPVIYVSWEDAQHYVAWFSQVTGKSYRLLSEAEYEYAARAGMMTEYPWGDDIHLNGTVMANCDGCGSKWDNTQTAPVGSFPPNKFGLYDMVGNVWVWTEDCWHSNYKGAPTNGSAWTAGGDCSQRVARGGSWRDTLDGLRSALRSRLPPFYRYNALGFRVARTLTP